MSNAIKRESHSPDVGRFAELIIKVLRPLVKLMVGNITFPAFLGMAKKVYIEEAINHLQKDDPNARVTKSSLALLTGIDTRAISQVLGESKQRVVYQAQDIEPLAKILGQWARNPIYSDPETSQPMDLAIYGRGITFQALVTRTVGRNITPQTVLDRLIETGNVELLNENTVRLLSRTYFPLAGAKYEMMEVGMHAVSNLLNTVQHNIDCGDNSDERFVQRQQWSRSLPPETYEQLKQEIYELLDRQTERSVELLESYEDPIPNNESLTAGVGFYFWEDLPNKKH